jgi:hypothetical protein
MLSLPAVTLECQPTAAEGENTEFAHEVSHTVIMKQMEVPFCVLTCIKHERLISMAVNALYVILQAVPYYTCFSSIISCYTISSITMKFNHCVLNLNSGRMDMLACIFMSLPVRSAERRTLLLSQNCQNRYRCGHFC